MSGRTIQGRQTKRFASFWFVAIGITLVWSLLAQFRAYSRLAKAEKDQERVRVCESHNRFQRSGNLIGDYDLVRLFRSFPTSDFAKGLQEKVDMLKPEYVIAAELPTQRETDKRYLIYFPGSPQELTIQIKLQSGPSILKVENTETQNVATRRSRCGRSQAVPDPAKSGSSFQS